jgi:hypothetical protein
MYECQIPNSQFGQSSKDLLMIANMEPNDDRLMEPGHDGKDKGRILNIKYLDGDRG